MSTALARLREEVDRWRASRQTPKSRVPEELWMRAVGVARTGDGVWKTSKALRFNYADLRQRVASASKSPPRSASIVRRPSEFVELPAMTVVRASGAMVVELFGSHNHRMRIEADPRVVDVAALVRAFWSER